TAQATLGVQSPGTRTNGELTTEDPAAAQVAPALALALGGARRALPVDLAHSRLAPPPQRRIKTTTALSIAAAALLVIGIGWLIYDVKSSQSHMTELTNELAGK